jgi:tRNA U34 5-methylaminomethyl-2-thiouridine-forming methyltransferase MnmC
MKNQQANLEWRDGKIPVSLQFDDPYFSLEDGLSETRHVFLAGNDLPARFRAGFHIAELGFGTGLNLCAALMSWREAKQTSPLRYTSFEAFPMTASQMERALQAFPEVLETAAPILAQLADGRQEIRLPDLSADIIVGDARQTLPLWSGAADAWFLDGFSPAKNPELWTADLMADVASHTAPNGSFATYTAAGFVRAGLSQGGFDVTRVTGFGRKRHMSVGSMKDST